MNTSFQNFVAHPDANPLIPTRDRAYTDPFTYFSSPLLIKPSSEKRVQSRQFFKKSLLCGRSMGEENSNGEEVQIHHSDSTMSAKKGLSSQIYFSHLQPHNSALQLKRTEEHYNIKVKEVCAPSTIQLTLPKDLDSTNSLFPPNRILASTDIYETNTSLSFERSSSLFTNSSTPHSQRSASLSQQEDPVTPQDDISQNYSILAAGCHKAPQDVSVFQITPPLYQPQSPRKREQANLSPRKSRLLSTKEYLLPKVIQNYEQYEYEPRLLRTEDKIQCYLEVSSSTLAEALTSDSVNILVVDCRFEYEYEGGHIKGALNISCPFRLEEQLLHCADKANSRFRNKTAIVFHCEFSSKRAPAMFSLMRDLDRKVVGIENYPQLLLPEMYVLRGGYSKFFQEYPELCEGSCGYTPMASQEPRNETETMSYYEENQMLFQQDIKKMF